MDKATTTTKSIAHTLGWKVTAVNEIVRDLQLEHHYEPNRKSWVISREDAATFLLTYGPDAE
jgi:broad-specificity NMP kinase